MQLFSLKYNYHRQNLLSSDQTMIAIHFLGNQTKPTTQCSRSNTKLKGKRNRGSKRVLTGTWRPISWILSMRSLTLWGSLALVRINGLLIWSSGSSTITGPPFPPLWGPPTEAPAQHFRNIQQKHRETENLCYTRKIKRLPRKQKRIIRVVYR